MAARDAPARGDGAEARRCAGLIWARLQPRIRVRVARKVPADEVDDVCGMVAESLCRYVYRSEDVPRSVVGLALAIASKRVADRTRSAQTAPDLIADEDLPGVSDPALQQVLDRAEADGLLASLDERAAAILRRTSAGEAAADVARDLGITRTNLDVIAHRARKRLRAAVEEARWTTPS